MKINIIKGLGKGIHRRIIKLSNGLFITQESECLKLFSIKNSKIKHISWSPKLNWPPLSYIELKDKSVIVTGRKYISIFKLEKERFKIIESKQQEVEQYAELFKIIQLDNEKIIISSIMGKLLVLEKKRNNYEITQAINVLRFKYDIEYISYNKILLIESSVGSSNINNNNECQTRINIIDFSRKEIVKKKLKFNYNFSLYFYYENKIIYNFENEYIFISIENRLFILSLKYEEIISVFEIEKIIDLVKYENDLYLFVFKNNKVGLLQYKDEIIIKKIKDIKNAFQIIKNDGKFNLYCLSDS